MSVNKVIVLGNLGKNAEVKEVNGNKLIKFSVATTEKWTDKSGNKQEKTEWHNVDYWSKSTAIAEYLKKGQTVYVEGSITTNKVDDKYFTSIKGSRVQLVGGKPKMNGQDMNEQRMNMDTDTLF